MPGRPSVPSRSVDQVVNNFELQGAEALERLLTHRVSPVKVFCDPASGAARAHGACVMHAGVKFSRTQCSGDITVVPQRPFDGVVFFLPLSGRIRIRQSNDVLVGTEMSAIACDGPACRAVEFSADPTYYSVALGRTHLSERLSVLLGRPIVEKPIFQPIVDRHSAGLRTVTALIDFATGPGFGPALFEGALAVRRLNDMLVDLVLETWPNSYSELLQRPPMAIAPRHVKLAIEFISEHPEASVDGAELAALGGVSLRALQSGFRRFAGTSIAAYQRHVRLARARDELVMTPTRSIEEIARAWGFTNAGRFSRYFRDAYGMSPCALVREMTGR